MGCNLSHLRKKKEKSSNDNAVSNEPLAAETPHEDHEDHDAVETEKETADSPSRCLASSRKSPSSVPPAERCGESRGFPSRTGNSSPTGDALSPPPRPPRRKWILATVDGAAAGNGQTRVSNNRSDGDHDFFFSSGSSTSSTPQLFRIEPTQRAEQRDGTWGWWYEQVERLRITKDYMCRAKLQDIPNRLSRQYDADKGQVELDMSWCFMERSAPYVLGRLLASPYLTEIRWITALRLDGNYFTDEGFGNMLAVMCEANERKPILPLLKHLYLNNMNLDPCSLHGILFHLFPLDLDRRQQTIAGKEIGPPSEAYIPFCSLPQSPLFPSLEVLSLCDNPGIGNQGFLQILRCFIASHFEGRLLSVLDLSRCAIDEVGVQYLREYLSLFPEAVKRGEAIVLVGRFVLIGNRHSIKDSDDVYTPHDVTFVL